MSDWVDFRALRKSLSFEDILRHYGVAVKKADSLHRGPCPLPTHTGKRSAPSFTAKLDHGTWQCFACKAHGQVLQFAARMEGLDPDDPQSIRSISLKLQQQFGKRPPSKAPVPKDNAVLSRRQVLVNPPLDFELKDLDPDHPYLKSRGFLPETVRSFGLGFCRRGLLKGRIAIPLHDGDRLVGYAGRLTEDKEISVERPKYLFPGTRERDERTMEFRPSALVYGLNRLDGQGRNIILVRGFPAVWWLAQWGYAATVSLVGDDCSQQQGRLVSESLKPDGQAWIFSGSSPKDAAWAATVLREISPLRWTRWIKLQNGSPMGCTPGDLDKLFR